MHLVAIDFMLLMEYGSLFMMCVKVRTRVLNLDEDVAQGQEIRIFV